MKSTQVSRWAMAFGVGFLMLLIPAAFADCGGAAWGRAPLGALAARVQAAAPKVAEAMANDSAKSAVSIVGLWNVNVYSDNTLVDVAFDAWHADGTEVLNDYTNPINGNVCLGVWKQTGTRTYKLKHPSWYFDNSGNLLGTIVIHETVKISADGKSYSGTYTDDIFDTNGNLVQEFSGRLKATRITAN